MMLLQMEELKEKVEEAPKKDAQVERVGGVLGILESVRNFIDKHGYVSTLNTILITGIIVMFSHFMYHPGAVFDRVVDLHQERHQKAINARLAADPEIRAGLKNLRLDLRADRAFIVETHNGGSNLTSLPFLFVDMTYEDTGEGIMPIIDEYKNLRLQKYVFMESIYASTFWAGSTDELKDIDEAFYYRVKGDGVEYMALMVLYGKGTVVGAIGLEYFNTPEIDGKKIQSHMMKHAGNFVPLLTYDPKK